MARGGTINLIPTNIENTPELAGIYELLRKIGVGGAITLVSTGLIVGGIFAYFSARRVALTTEKDAVIAVINQQSIKEGLLLTAKQRVAVLDKILADQKNLSALFSLVREVAPVGALESVALDETNKVTVKVHIDAIADAIAIEDAILERAKTKTVTKPVLVEFTIPKEGGFELAFSFVPKL